MAVVVQFTCCCCCRLCCRIRISTYAQLAQLLPRILFTAWPVSLLSKARLAQAWQGQGLSGKLFSMAFNDRNPDPCCKNPS